MAHWLKDPALSLSWVGTLAQELPQAAGVAKKKKKKKKRRRRRRKIKRQERKEKRCFLFTQIKN